MNVVTKCFVLAASLLLATPAVAQQGVKQTERLVKRADDAVKEIGETKAQIHTTLGIYNALMGGTGPDATKLYSDLQKSAASSQKKRADVTKRGDEMEQEAHKFFEEWSASIAGISSESLKSRSMERLSKTRGEFGEILAAGRKAGSEFDLFMAALRDQIVYLGHDLNPSGIASLSEDATKLNVQAEAMLERVDAVTATIERYADSLRAK